MNKILALLGAIGLLISCGNQKPQMEGAYEFKGLNNSLDSVSYAIGMQLAKNSQDQNLYDLNFEKVYESFDLVLDEKEVLYNPSNSFAMVREHMNSLKSKKQAGEDLTLVKFDRDSYRDSISYAVGVTFGENIFRQNLGDLNRGGIRKGFQDSYAGAMLMEMDQIKPILDEHKKAIFEKQKEMNKEQGTAFLAENANAEGVQTTASGLQYKVLSQGDGPKPLVHDDVKVHYTGTLIDGTKFDSSVDRGEPITFPLGGVIPGWTEGLQLMPQGSKYKLYIPSDLAYGERGAGGVIGPNSTLIFDVELLEVLKKEPPRESRMGESEPVDFVSFEENRKKEGVQETASGLQYRVIIDEDGPKPRATDKVTCHYTGMLVDGSKFDSSVDRGRPSEFGLNQVIKGWTEGLQLMSPGSIYRFYIPYDLAYGETGRPPRIPAKATLVFDVELLKIN